MFSAHFTLANMRTKIKNFTCVLRDIYGYCIYYGPMWRDVEREYALSQRVKEGSSPTFILAKVFSKVFWLHNPKMELITLSHFVDVMNN